MSLSNYLESALLRLALHGTSWTPPGTRYLALFTTATDDAGGGTEVTGGGYARQVITFAAESGGAASNDTTITFTNLPAATVTHAAICTALTGGNFLFHGSIGSPRSVIAGTDLYFDPGDIVATLG